MGGGAGVLLAMWLIGPLVALSPADLGVAGAVTVDKSVLLFGLAVSTLAGSALRPRAGASARAA